MFVFFLGTGYLNHHLYRAIRMISLVCIFKIEVVSEPGARIAFSAVVCMGEIPLDYA